MQSSVHPATEQGGQRWGVAHGQMPRRGRGAGVWPDAEVLLWQCRMVRGGALSPPTCVHPLQLSQVPPGGHIPPVDNP